MARRAMIAEPVPYLVFEKRNDGMRGVHGARITDRYPLTRCFHEPRPRALAHAESLRQRAECGCHVGSRALGDDVRWAELRSLSHQWC